jgi:hypothetical protein
MHRGRATLYDELFLEAGVQQTLSNGRFLRLEFRWNSYISIERRERKIFEFSRDRMKSVQPVGPASNQHDLT